jgi:hypothetical protein
MSAETNNIKLMNRQTLTIKRIASGNLQNCRSQMGTGVQKFEGVAGVLGRARERSATLERCLACEAEGCRDSPESDVRRFVHSPMLDQTKEVYILADSTKLGDNYSSFWTPFPETWTLITDSGATESPLAPFRASPGVRIEIGQIKDEPRMDTNTEPNRR